MRRPISIVGRAALIAGNPGIRRAVFAVLIAVCAILSFYPQKFRAALTLTPADPSSLGLGGTLGQLGALNSVFGNQSAIEVSVRVANSPYVRQKVAQRLNLGKRLGKTDIQTSRWLDRKVEVRSMRGGIIQFEVSLTDGELGREIVAAYGDAVREQLGIIARNQTGYKRQILLDLVQEASDKLDLAQSAYDNFRLTTRYSQPQAAITAIGDRIPALEQAIKSKQVELNAQRQFATDANMRTRQILAEIEALQAQLSEARSVSPVEQNSVGRVVRQSTQADRLRRNLDLAQGLYDNYKKFLQGTSVEDLTSTANVRILEPAYIDPERQYNMIPLLAGVALLLIALAIEFYTLRLPVGEGAALRKRELA